jgi:transcriptional regulator with XRE-family HTH domain
MKLHERLSELRKSKGCTLKDVAWRVGVAYQYIHKLESGKAVRPKLELLYKLAAYYQFSSDTLVAEAGKIPSDVYWKVVESPELIAAIRIWNQARDA